MEAGKKLIDEPETICGAAASISNYSSIFL